MYFRFFISLCVVLGLFISAALFSPTMAEENNKKSSKAKTTIEPGIPTDELSLILKPFTKDELLVEAEGWLQLVRAKAIEIGLAEVAVKRQNKEIEKAKDIQKDAQKAKEQIKKVEEKADAAESSGKAEKIVETEEAANEAAVTIDKIKEQVDEASKAAAKTDAIENRMAETVEGHSEAEKVNLADTVDAAGKAQEAMGRVQDAVTDTDLDSKNSVRQAAGEAKKASQDAQEATADVENKAEKALENLEKTKNSKEGLGTTVKVMEQVEEDKKDEKNELLENVNNLREERTLLVDNLKAVIGELESKTDEGDKKTIAIIKDYNLYVSSVQGINLDIKDTTSAWVTIKGWMFSDEGGLRLARNFLKFIGILFLAWIVSKLFSRLLHRALSITDNLSQLLQDFLSATIGWLILIAGFLMALSALEVSVAPLIAVVGAAGFAIAFALQSSLSNIASGIMILFFRPFDVGDFVEAGGAAGTVTSMNLFATSIKSTDNKDVIVPNNSIWSDIITNATGVTTRRVDMVFKTGYSDDIEKAEEILKDIIENHPLTLKDPEPTIRMHALADFSVDFICRPWVKTEDYWNLYWDVTKNVKHRFDEEGIDIPYPKQDVHLYIEKMNKDELA